MALLTVTALCGWPLADLHADEAKWAPWLDVGGKFGHTRRIGEADLFLPVAQDGERLLFLDLRGIMDNLEQREGNFGLGYRQMLENGWNLGAYGFFDRRQSSTAHHYSQVTVGAEALGPDMDLRVNGYIPIGQTTNEVEGSARADIVGSTIQIQSGYEHAYYGTDAEMGWRVPLFEAESDKELRLYGGGYWFDADKSDAVAGPRLRLEFRLYDPLEEMPGTRLTTSIEVQRDDARGTQEFFGLKLRFPLQPEPSTRRMTPQERRMTDPVIRDVDIVTQSATVVEAAKFDGQALSSVATINNGTTAQSAINAAGTNTLIVVQGTTSVTSQLTLLTGQTLSSGGSTIMLTGASSGRAVSFTLPGGNGALTGAIAGTSVLSLSQGSTLRGLTVENTSTTANSHAVSAANISGATITGSRLIAAKGNGLWADHADGLSLTDTRVNSAGANAVTLQYSNNAKLSGNTVSATSLTGHGLYMKGGGGHSLSGNTISASGNRASAVRMDQTTGTLSNNTITTSGNAGNIDSNDVAHALWITQGGGSTLSGNTVSASGSYGSALYIDNSAAIAISGNQLTAGGYAGRGLQLFNSAGATISGNTIGTTDTTTGTGFYTAATGLFMENSANTTISGNTITTVGEAASMNLRYSNGLTVSGNTISTVGIRSTGLVLTGSANSQVTGNRVTTTGSASDGMMFFVNANNVHVENNIVTVTGGGSWAVLANTVNDLHVVNNRLVGNGNGGVSQTNSNNTVISGNTP